MRVFISYRRQDAQAAAGWIAEHLRREFGDDSVFRDSESIPLGVNFVTRIEEAVGRARVLIALIGPRWASTRLQDANDFVRLEIEAALKANIPVIPVFVEGAKMPAEDQVPATVRPLRQCQGLQLDLGRDFSNHVRALVEAIKRLSPAQDLGSALNAAKPHIYAMSGVTAQITRQLLDLEAEPIDQSDLAAMLRRETRRNELLKQQQDVMHSSLAAWKRIRGPWEEEK